MIATNAAEYRRLYLRFHRRYFQDERFNYNICFYCGDETDLCDHSPSIRTLAEKGRFHLLPLPDGHVKKNYFLPMANDESLRPVLVPACRGCLGLLQRGDIAETPEERKRYVVRRKMERSGLGSMIGVRKEERKETSKKKSPGQIYLDREKERREEKNV